MKLTDKQARAIVTAVLQVLSAGWRNINEFTPHGQRMFIRAVKEAAHPKRKRAAQEKGEKVKHGK